MSTTFSMPAPGRGMLQQSSVAGLLAVAKGWWVAYFTWRVEAAAIAHLRSMSDRELEDFGLLSSGISAAVSGVRREPIAAIAEINRSVDAG